MTTDYKKVFLDTNVLIYQTFEESVSKDKSATSLKWSSFVSSVRLFTIHYLFSRSLH
jgi:predicted nucleic acid-binding protein